MKKIVLTPEQEDYIKAHYNEMTDREIASRLGVRPAVIYNWRLPRGYRKDPQFIARYAKAHVSEKFLRNSYSKGHVPSNKGKTWDEYMSPEGQKGSSATCFKPGRIPPNHREIGETSIRTDTYGRKYRYIKISEDQDQANMVLLHRYIWEQANGKIPDGMVITFKDGNTLNCKLENLELISVGDRMRQNSFLRYPEELRKTMRLVKKAERLIDKNERNKLR